MRPRSETLAIGVLIVMTLAVQAVWAAEPVTIALAVQTTSTGAIELMASVLDDQRAPVAQAAVSFKVRTAFGWLPLAEVSTDQAGRAQVTLPEVGPTEIVAETGERETIRASIRLGERKPVEPAVRPDRSSLSRLSPQPGLISPYPVPVQVLFLALILGGIWATYGYLVSLLVRIRLGR